MSYRPTKNVAILSVTSLFNDISSEMILAVLPAFFITVLNSGASALGLVEGLSNGASNFIKIYTGRFSDKLRKRKSFILSGYSISVITRPLYVPAATVTGVAGLRVLDRIGKGLRESPRDALISLSTPKEEIGRAFGFHRAFDTIGAIIGPLITYLILRAYPSGYRIVFVTSFVAGLLAVLTILFVREAANELRKTNISSSPHSHFSEGLKRYLIALLFLSMGSIPITVLLLKTQSIGLALASIPLFYLLYNLSYAGLSFPAGKLKDIHGSKIIIVIGYAILLVAYALVAFAESTPSLIIAFLALGLFPALTDGVQRALASELSSTEERGGALGYVNAVSGMGLLVAGVVGGYIWQQFGLIYALGLAGAFVLIGMSILLTVGKES